MGDNLRIDTAFDYLPLVVSILAIIIIGVVRNLYSKKFRTQIEGYFQPRYLDQIMREESNATQLPMILLQINGFLSFALCAYLALIEFGFDEFKSWGLYSLCFAAIVAIFTYHSILSFITQFYLQSDFGLSEHRYHNTVIYQIVGLALIPINLLAAYAKFWNEIFLYIGVGIISISLIYKYIYASFRGIQLKLSVVYIILYLCTLEILPLVAILGVLMGEKVEIN